MDAEWAIVESPLQFPQRTDRRGRSPAETRAVLNGVLWILRTGAQWRELPEKYLPYQTVHGCFQQRVRSGQLEKALPCAGREVARGRQARSGRRLYRWQLRGSQKGGLAVGKTKRDKGAKIMAIAAGHSVPVAVTIDSASPHVALSPRKAF